MEGPITERSNEKSSAIDMAPPTDILRILADCDDEIFQGYQGSDGILNKQIVSKMECLITFMAQKLASKDDWLVVVGGCGTSGRLAFIIVSSINNKLVEIGQKACFKYLIAGGDKALFVSQEAVEDDPNVGVEDLLREVNLRDKVIYIGITCGLSAPYVGGQIDYALDHPDRFTPVLLGFNPVEQARRMPVEKWDKTFKDVVLRLQHAESTGKAYILNPIVGPEPIAGSSRMKSGSATKIMLEVICTAAILRAFKFELQVKCLPTVVELIEAYRLVKQSTYKEADNIAKIIEQTGEAFVNGSHLYYVSGESIGLIGLLDASECPPTFGASSNDVRGFIAGGYGKLQNKQGEMNGFFDISTDYFTNEISLDPTDVVVILHKYDGGFVLPKKQLFKICFCEKGSREDRNDTVTQCNSINIDLPYGQLEDLLGKQVIKFTCSFYMEMSIKWVCNCISTGGFILNGKIYENYMIDVKVTNNKLYHRALGIIQRFSDVASGQAKQALLMAIYETDCLNTELMCAPTSKHIDEATKKFKVVPIAIVICKRNCSFNEAKEFLNMFPIVKQAIIN